MKKLIVIFTTIILIVGCSKDDVSFTNSLSVEGLSIPFEDVVYADFGAVVSEDHFQRIYWFYDSEVEIGTETISCEDCTYYVVVNLLSKTSTEEFSGGNFTNVNFQSNAFAYDADENYARIFVYEIIPPVGEIIPNPQLRYAAADGSVTVKSGSKHTVIFKGKLWKMNEVETVIEQVSFSGSFSGTAEDTSFMFEKKYVR
ncbi:MAG: hypothetical protein RIF46_05190 [Cyclobacteriaceae bacterium]